MPVSLRNTIEVELVGGPMCGDSVETNALVLQIGQVVVGGDLYRMETDELDNEHRASYIGRLA